MALNVRMKDPTTGQEYSFSPARDIAYFWPTLIEHAYAGLVEKKWESWLADYIKHTSVTEKEILKALAAYFQFCQLAVDSSVKTPADALEKSGFFKCPAPAQLVVCAKLGQLATGAFWAGIRSSTHQGDVPEDIARISEFGKNLAEELSKRWSDDEYSKRHEDNDE